MKDRTYTNRKMASSDTQGGDGRSAVTRRGYAEVGQQEERDGVMIAPSLEGSTLFQSLLSDWRVQTAIKVVIGLITIRLLYGVLWILGHVGVLILVGVIAYQVYVRRQGQQAEELEERERQMRMERINREREESEKMVHEAARMMLDINRRHLEDYLTNHPAATYEEWIADLHPENVMTEETHGVEGKKIAIDHRYYVEDSDHRILWNEMITASQQEADLEGRAQNYPQHKLVPARSSMGDDSRR